MGGHAFRDLHCPRISTDIYAQVKLHITAALRMLFSHVVVPTEMPEKADYGDVDFLVSGPLLSPASTTMDNFDWTGAVAAIKSGFNTTHGRRGFLNPDCMYFAIRAPGCENDFWVQVDVKVCPNPEMFEWQTFELNYASNSKMIGSMLKPLGLTMDPEGLHIRVEEMEETNFPGSMVWVSKDPRDVLRIAGLDRRIVDAGFKTQNEIYEYFASSWLFNPGHFAARLANEMYNDRLEDRAPHWTFFVRKWVPMQYPGYKFVADSASSNASIDTAKNQDSDELQAWYKRTRASVREKVFTMFPQVAAEYYIKRAAHVKEREEQRLRAIIMVAVPVGDDGWDENFLQPHCIIKAPDADPSTPDLKPTAAGEITPPMTPSDKIFHAFSLPSSAFSSSAHQQTKTPWDIPMYLEALSRTPPSPCTPRPPPVNMSQEAKLLCLARWTLFDPINGAPYLLSSPRAKDFDMHWTDATYAGAADEVLVKWAKEMWWHVWVRQSHTNYVGMWKKRFEKEDRKAERLREEEDEKVKAREMAEKERKKIQKRLEAMNDRLGLIEKV